MRTVPLADQSEEMIQQLAEDLEEGLAWLDSRISPGNDTVTLQDRSRWLAERLMSLWTRPLVKKQNATS